MTAILNIYDKITAPNSVSLGITVAATAYSVYCAYDIIHYLNYVNPTIALASLCAGIALAILAHVYLVHNSEVKNNSERNSIYAALSLTAGFTNMQSTYFVSTALNGIINSLQYFRYPMSYISIPHPFTVGFLLTTLVLQIITQNKKDDVLEAL